MAWFRRRKVVRRKAYKRRYVKKKSIIRLKKKPVVRKYVKLRRTCGFRIRQEFKDDFKVTILKNKHSFNKTTVLNPDNLLFKPFALGGENSTWIPQKTVYDISKDWDRFTYHKLAKVIVKYRSFSLDLLEIAGHEVVDSDGMSIPTLQILDPPAYQPTYSYAAWTYTKPSPVEDIVGCRLQNLSADISGGTNNVVSSKRLNNFPFYLYKTDGSVDFPTFYFKSLISLARPV